MIKTFFISMLLLCLLNIHFSSALAKSNLLSNKSDNFSPSIHYDPKPFNFELSTNIYGGSLIPNINTENIPKIISDPRFLVGMSLSLGMYFLKYVNLKLELGALPLKISKMPHYFIGLTNRFYLWNLFIGYGFYYHLFKHTPSSDFPQTIYKPITFSLETGWMIPLHSNVSIEIMARYMHSLTTFMDYTKDDTQYIYSLNIVLVSVGLNFLF